MNEHGFIRAIHKKLPPELYVWKISDRYTAGIADAWYSGNGGDCWVEYKYLKRTPRRKFANPLTKLQRRWAADRVTEGRTVAVAIGVPDGVILLQAPDQWTQDELVIQSVLTRAEYIKWLTQKTLR